jgi:hypothetical protein
MSSYSIKEFNKKRRETELWGRNLERKKVRPNFNRNKSEGEDMFGMINLNKGIVEREHLTLLTRNDRNLSLNEREVNTLGKYPGAMFSKGKREGSKCSIYTTESEGVSQHWQGYIILIEKNNDQNVHREGICWSNYLASTTEGIRSEAGVSSVTKELIDKKFNGPMIRITLVTKEENNFVIRCEAVVKINWISQRYISCAVVNVNSSEFDSSPRKALEHEYRSLSERINYTIGFVCLKISFVMKGLMLLATESGKRVLIYGILPSEEEGVPHVGLGYIILKTDYNQKVHGEGVRRRNNFALFINKNYLETGADIHLVESKLMERTHSVLSVIIDFQLGGDDLASSRCDGVLAESRMFKIFQRSFEKVRILVWMVFVMFMVIMMTGASQV